MKYDIDADGVSHYILGELSYNDFDKSRRIGMWQLAKLIQGARHQRFRSVTMNLKGLGITSFVRSQFLQIYPAFYTSKLTQNRALDITSRLSHLGRTSCCLDTDMYDLSTKTLLASGSVQDVFVSRQTRRPFPVASIAWQQTKVITPRDQRPISGPDFPARPTGTLCFTQTRTVMSSDTDANDHLNEAMFIRFCFDCASSAALDGHLPSFRKDVIYADAKTVWFLYIREARVGEELTLYCWEDRNLSRTLWVEMCQESQVIGQCQIQFYEDGLTRSTSEPDGGLTLAKL
ncbi:uncharacterized protein LOC119746354 [Patiria miniata]|uniref:Uncharacterized protein n=1 Tax=Patiria miniata TaxID=46514 RepID=A0A914BT71_PATMI|nr:uncharacterized protein LOC119746354 [Patiria miniata]